LRHLHPEPVAPLRSLNPIAVPAQGTASTIDMATWNLLYFGAPNQGPSDDLLQMARVRDVILGTDADIWGVQEVTSRTEFDNLIELLPGYDGLLANDPIVVGGSDSYHISEIKVGLIYKTAVLQPTSARIIRTDLDHAFAGRPPLEVSTRLTFGGATHDAVVIVLHAKASSDAASWNRRAAGGHGLKEYLDATWPDALVLVPGDWNDDLDRSITVGRDTPYRAFLDAPADWGFPTAELSAAGETSILGFSDIIDHILASNEVMAWYRTGSTLVYRVDRLIPNYRETTSDHLPVLVRFQPSGS
ncbi:MAG: endonuclease/exonuclease/phosphatase family protein, partial [Gemmatimonadetes bacterium]|nr:endonuclease/exonuclease/phosphatase family protein [Gemmatimonadota bacterium]